MCFKQNRYYKSIAILLPWKIAAIWHRSRNYDCGTIKRICWSWRGVIRVKKVMLSHLTQGHLSSQTEIGLLIFCRNRYTLRMIYPENLSCFERRRTFIAMTMNHLSSWHKDTLAQIFSRGIDVYLTRGLGTSHKEHDFLGQAVYYLIFLISSTPTSGMVTTNPYGHTCTTCLMSSFHHPLMALL